MSRISNCHGSVLELCILPIQQQKNSIDCGIFAIAHATEILHGGNVGNSSLDVILMRDHSLVCLQLQKFPPLPKTSKSVYRCRHVSLFFTMCCICREAYFYGKLQQCVEWYHKKCMKIPIKVFRNFLPAQKPSPIS